MLIIPSHICDEYKLIVSPLSCISNDFEYLSMVDSIIYMIILEKNIADFAVLDIVFHKILIVLA